MQRAISYLSIFLTDFDIEDPDHDLAGFGEEGVCASTHSSMLEGNNAGGEGGEGGGHGRDVESDSSDSDDIFLAACRPSEPVRRRHEQHGKRWSSTTNLLAMGRDSPVTAAKRAHVEEASLHQMSSSRSVGEPLTESPPQNSWLVWLKRRWSPLKEGNLQVLVDKEGPVGQRLLDRYLTEQTRMHEVAQAELIKRESQQEDGRLLDSDCHSQWLDAVGAHANAALAERQVESRTHTETPDNGEQEDDQGGNTSGNVSVSDSCGDSAKARRQSRLSSASTAEASFARDARFCGGEGH
jgi:hypothetical protein